MQHNGLTAALAVLWLLNSVTAISLPPAHLMPLDQYSQQTAESDKIYQDETDAGNWMTDQELREKTDSPDRYKKLLESIENVFRSIFLEHLFNGSSESINLTGPLPIEESKSATDKINNESTTLLGLDDKSLSLADAEDFEDQGPGSVEIYKLDLFKDKAILPNEIINKSNKSKIPKKVVVKWVELRGNSVKAPQEKSHNQILPKVNKGLVSEQVFGTGGVPELQVGCEGQEDASSERDKRSIDDKAKSSKEADPRSVHVVPINVDFDYESTTEEIYEEMDELLKLKKLEETTTSEPARQRGDMDPTINEEESRGPDALPERGDLGKTFETSTAVSDGQLKSKSDRQFVGKRKSYWDKKKPLTRQRRESQWGYGENEGLLAEDGLTEELNTRSSRDSSDYQTRENPRRYESMQRNWQRADGQPASPYEQGVPYNENRQSGDDRRLEQRRREEEEHRRRLEEQQRRRNGSRRKEENPDDLQQRQQHEDQRRNDPQRRREYEESRRNDPNSRRIQDEEAQRRRQYEDQRRNDPNSRRNEDPESQRRREIEERRRNDPNFHLIPRTEADPEVQRRREQENQRRNEPQPLLRREDPKADPEAQRRREQENQRRNEPQPLLRREDTPEALRRRDYENQRRQEEERRRNNPDNRRREEEDKNRRREHEEQRRRYEEERRRRDDEENEKKLQDYIRRNNPIRPGPANEPPGAAGYPPQRASGRYDNNYQNPPSLGRVTPRYEEMRRRQDSVAPYNNNNNNNSNSNPQHQQQRDVGDQRSRRVGSEQRQRQWQEEQEARRREYEARREEARRLQNERDNLQQQQQLDPRRTDGLEQVQQVQRPNSIEGRRLHCSETHCDGSLRAIQEEEQRRRQQGQPAYTNYLSPATEATVESLQETQRIQPENKRIEVERDLTRYDKRRDYGLRVRPLENEETAQVLAEDYRRRMEEARLKGLPVSAQIIIRGNKQQQVPQQNLLQSRFGGGEQEQQPPPQNNLFQSRFGETDDSVFQGINPHRPGHNAPNFPAPSTSKPPAVGPPACIWAVSHCCSTQQRRLPRCFESMGCPGASWDPEPCRESIVSAARAEINKFYAEEDKYQ